MLSNNQWKVLFYFDNGCLEKSCWKIDYQKIHLLISFFQQHKKLIPALYWNKILYENLNFSTRFSCEHFAVGDFVTLFMGGKTCFEEMFCLGMVSTNMSQIYKI